MRQVIENDSGRDGQPGEVRCDRIVPTPGGAPLGHSLSPEALLHFAQQLYGRAPEAVVLAVAGERFGMGESLSPDVRRAIPRTIRAVVRQARFWASRRSRPSSPSVASRVI